jgi:hypothetical protein
MVTIKCGFDEALPILLPCEIHPFFLTHPVFTKTATCSIGCLRKVDGSEAFRKEMSILQNVSLVVRLVVDLEEKLMKVKGPGKELCVIERWITLAY